MTAASEIDIGELPQECVYDAAIDVMRRHYRRIETRRDDDGLWRNLPFLAIDNPCLAVVGQAAVAFHIDSSESPERIYEALVDGSLNLSRWERRQATSLSCGEVFDAVHTVLSHMSAIYELAMVLYLAETQVAPERKG